MANLQTLEAKMANIEESLSFSAVSRRRKGTSLGNVSSRSSSKLDTILSFNNYAQHSKDQERDMQNLRLKLSLENQPPSQAASTHSSVFFKENGEKPVSEQKLSRLRNDAESKNKTIRNLKSALQKLDESTTLDIDSRIRQAELEYALGREELQLLSLVEEARVVQGYLDKNRIKSEMNSLCSLIRNGQQLSLHAVQASKGRWNATQKHDSGDGFFVDWVMEGEELQRGDRILEINGRVLNGRNNDELQKLCSNTTKCDMVVIRNKSISTVNVISSSNTHHHQQLQADNMRLQHRISYLEEQVKELLDVQKEKTLPAMFNGRQRSGTHITSISISSSPSDHDDENSTDRQRGSYITTIVDGGPQKQPVAVAQNNSFVQKSLSTTNINRHHYKESSQETDRSATSKSVKNLSSSLSRISISTDLYVQKQRRERERKERERYYNNKNSTRNAQQSLTKNRITASMNQIENSYSNRRHDERSVKSLDFESDNGHTTNYDDYASEPVPSPKIRPAPPKKPLRLSLQRAQSLQVVSDEPQTINTPLMDTINLSSCDRKRASKRIYRDGQHLGINSRGKLGYSRSKEFSTRFIEKYV